MHTYENVDPSNTNYNIQNERVQEEFNWFELFEDLESSDSTLINPFLVATPQSRPLHQQRSASVSFHSQYSDPHKSPLYQDSLPDLDSSQSTQLSSQLQTPTSDSSPIVDAVAYDPHSDYEDDEQTTPTTKTFLSTSNPLKIPISPSKTTSPTTIILQSPFKTPPRISSPFAGLGKLTPGRKRSNVELEEKAKLGSRRAEVCEQSELDSPFRNLGLLTPGRRTVRNHPVSPISPTTPHSISAVSTSTPGLDSPFNRLGLCTPGKRSLTQPSEAISLPELNFSPSPCSRPFKRKPQLYIPSPGWRPDTPTPYRFSNTSGPSYDLTPPRQPLFTSITKTPHTPSKNIKLELPPTPPLVIATHQRANITDDSEIDVNFIAHLSTDGGLISSLRRLKGQMIQSDSEMKGLNMFINPPKRSVRETDEKEVVEAAEILRSFGDEFAKISMAHAVHTTNILSSKDDLRKTSKESIICEMDLAYSLGIPTLVIHLGSEGKAVKEDDKLNRDRMDVLISDLKEILRRTKDVILAIENTVHPSSSSLTFLQSLALLFTLFPHPRLKLCLDLAHVHVSELDLNDADHREDLFQMLKRIGKDRIAGIHLGGSWTEHGGRGDRHAGIGFGSISLSSIRSILLHPLFNSIPTLLETPKYHRYFRQSRVKPKHKFKNQYQSSLPASSTRIKQIDFLEFQRYSLERKLVQDLINTSDVEWEINQYKLFNEYLKDRKKIGNEIYKILSKRGGNQWEKFRLSRRKEMICCRRIQGKKRREDNVKKVREDMEEQQGI